MSRGYYVPCAPFLYFVPDSSGQLQETSGGTGAAMDVQLRQPPPPGTSPTPFQYLIHEQAKSLVALQELQNEVGALLEFRELVMETFPHLRTPSNNKWGPGVRVRRKIQVNKDKTKSSETSTVQDSGFSTETKEHHSSSSPKPEPDSLDELCHLLDVIECKGTRLRDEVDELQSKLKYDVATKVRGGGGESKATPWLDNPTEDVRSWGDEDESREIHLLRHERDLLLDKVTDMEAETLEARIRISHLQNELHHVSNIKKDLEEQLMLIKNYELNKSRPSISSEPATPQRAKSLKNPRHTLPTPSHFGFHPIERSSSNPSPRKIKQVTVLHHDTTKTKIPAFHSSLQALGKLDGILSEPAMLKRSLNSLNPKMKPDAQKVAAILREENTLELKRHLITTVVDNQALKLRLMNNTRKMNCDLDRLREENDELKFQLEEKRIELEGTRARVRLLEKQQMSQHLKSDIALVEDANNSSSTESAHDHTPTPAIKGKKPSRIPLPPSKHSNKQLLISTSSKINNSLGSNKTNTAISLSSKLKEPVSGRNSLPRKQQQQVSTMDRQKQTEPTKDSMMLLVGDSLNSDYLAWNSSPSEYFDSISSEHHAGLWNRHSDLTQPQDSLEISSIWST